MKVGAATGGAPLVPSRSTGRDRVALTTLSEHREGGGAGGRESERERERVGGRERGKGSSAGG